MARLTRRLVITSKITLKILEARDARALYTLTEANRARLRVWLPWLDWVRKPSDSMGFIKLQERRWSEGQELVFGIFYRGNLAGIIGTHGIDWTNRKTTLGYWLGAEFEGRGLVLAACREFLNVLFRDLKMNRVGIHCATGNRRSRAVARRLGFRQEGIQRQTEWLYDHFVDHVVYSRLASDRYGRGSQRKKPLVRSR